MIPSPVHEAPTRRQDVESAVSFAALALFGVDPWREPQTPPPPGIDMLADATLPHHTTVTERDIALDAEDQLSLSPGSP